MSKISPVLKQHTEELKNHLTNAGHVLLNDAYQNVEELTSQAEKLSYSTINRPAHEKIAKAEANEVITAAAQEFAELFDKQVKQVQVLKLTAESFTLMHTEEPSAGYEAVIFLSREWHEEFRGTLSYTKGDGDAIYIQPKPNAASIVKRDENTMSFFKKVTYHAKDKYLYVVQAQLE